MISKPLASLLLLALTSMAIAEDRAYQIHINRPDHKGDHATIELAYANVSSSQTTWENFKDPVVDEHTFGTHLIADTESLEVNQGHEVADGVTVKVFTKMTDDGESQVLPVGARIVARVGNAIEGTIFRVNGKVPSTDVRDVLSQIIYISPPDQAVDYDAIFGSSTPRKPGESWPIDAKRAADVFVASGTKVKPSDVSGTTRFVGVEKCNDMECLRIEADTEVKNYSLPHTRFRQGQTTQPTATDSVAPRFTGTFTSHSVWLVPVDSSKDIPRRSNAITQKFEDDGEVRGQKYHRETTFQRQSELRELLPGESP